MPSPASTSTPTRRLRIAVGRVNQETNSLSTVPSRLQDFDVVYKEGETLLRDCRPGGDEIPGLFPRAELRGAVDVLDAEADVEVVGLSSSWALPGGKLDTAGFHAVAQRLIDQLANAGTLDGAVLALHGAWAVDGIADPESALIRLIRKRFPGLKLVATFDMHANMTSARIQELDGLVGYRTNPHRDQAATGARAAKLLLGILRNQTKPTAAWRSLPILLGGGTTLDFLPPIRGFLKRMSKVESDPRVLSTSFFMCHPALDAPEMGWSVVVTTNNDQALAEALVDKLADSLWALRLIQPPKFMASSAAIAKARSLPLLRKTGAVFFAETSDAATAGAPGENPNLVRDLYEQATDMVSFCGVRDPESINSLWDKALGHRVEIAVGGKLDKRWGPPCEIRGVIVAKAESPGFGRRIRITVQHADCAGRMELIVCEGPALIVKPTFYTDLGLRIMDADIVVVKTYFPFIVFFAPFIRWVCPVQTRGITDFEAAFTLPTNAPLHPRDHVEDWRAIDKKRRSLTAH